MKRLAFIVPSLHQGGLENYVTVLVNHIAKNKDIKISILCYYNNPVFYTLHPNVELIVPTYGRRGTSTIHYYVKSVVFLRKNLQKIKPATVVSLGDYINFISIAVAKSLKMPVFVGDRSSPGKTFPFLVRLFRQWSYPKAQGIIAQTQRAKAQKELMLGKGVPIQIIPNPIRDIRNYELSKENVVLCVARHYHVKGIDRLLAAFANIKDRTWRLEVAGSEGPETQALKEQAITLGIAERVRFLGARKDIDRIYSYSSILVLPSRSEGLPNALIEAMAHGLACISFDINAGPSDVIEHEVNGILVEDGDVGEMTRQLDRLICNESLRITLGEKATLIKEQYTLERITGRFLDFINSRFEIDRSQHTLGSK
jgi:GalNAc-alpha-(1->4)-GalNAc-alpha-(1->3)-diNAcBac-PP-undecaprenol alpha-1,4-N-acetyl-D-galactosaminyltransferase